MEAIIMDKCSRILLAVCFAVTASFLAAMPASAQSGDIEAQIKALEAEVQKIEPLKDQIERLRYQQLEMKKEATSAAAEMPSFTYRPGRGLTIAAADKSWSWNNTYRINMYNYNVLGGKTNFNDDGSQRNTGTTFGEIFPRRNRLYTTFCWSDCFYEFEYSIDGETAGDNGRQASVRDNEFYVHWDQLNPYLPYFSVGLRRGAGRTHIGRSSDNDGRAEHDIVFDGFQWGGDGSHAGAGLGWDGVDIGSGEYQLFLNWASSQQGSHQEFIQSDRKGIMAFIGGKPFANTKNKWLSGLDIGIGYQGQSMDRPSNYLDGEGTQISVRSTERRGRVTFFQPAAVGQANGNCLPAPDNDACSGQNVGGGWASIWVPGMKWQVGPYMFRAVYVSTRYANVNKGADSGLNAAGTQNIRGSGIWGRGFTIDHQLMVWSPKGFFTGSQTTPNTLQFSWGIGRNWMGCGRACDASPGTGSFHSQAVTLIETDLWYWLGPSLGVGLWWNHWELSNTPYRTAVAVGCADSRTEALSGKGVGKSCNFDSVNTGLRFRW